MTQVEQIERTACTVVDKLLCFRESSPKNILQSYRYPPVDGGTYDDVAKYDILKPDLRAWYRMMPIRGLLF